MGVAEEAEFAVERPFILETRLRAATRSSALILPNAVPPQAFNSVVLALIGMRFVGRCMLDYMWNGTRACWMPRRSCRARRCCPVGRTAT